SGWHRSRWEGPAPPSRPRCPSAFLWSSHRCCRPGSRVCPDSCTPRTAPPPRSPDERCGSPPANENYASLVSWSEPQVDGEPEGTERGIGPDVRSPLGEQGAGPH